MKEEGKSQEELARENADLKEEIAELINYLSVIIALRAKKILKTTLLSKKTKIGAAKMISDVYSYKQVMRYLAKYKIVKVGDSDNGYPVKLLNISPNSLLNSVYSG